MDRWTLLKRWKDTSVSNQSPKGKRWSLVPLPSEPFINGSLLVSRAKASKGDDVI